MRIPIRILVSITDRRGEGLLAFLIVFLPVAVLLTSMAVDGMGAAASYRRAAALASIGAQAGGSAIRYTGGGADGGGQAACTEAVQAICENVSQGCNSPNVSITCVPEANGVRVRVALRPIRMISGPFSVGPEWVVGTARSQAQSGIEFRD
ncbi:MAG: hypothetical protein ACUVSX_15065 [Aggregatilineales bacterium]